MKDISLLEIIQNKKDDILKDIEDVDTRYDEGNGELNSGDYAEIRDALDSKFEVINEILNEYEKAKKPGLDSVISVAEQRYENKKYCVSEISLLSSEEYEKHSTLIPFWFLEGANEFWLRNAGTEKGCVMGVTDDGFVNECGFDVTEELGVRPVLEIKKLGLDDGQLYPGSSIGLLGQTWTILEFDGIKAFALCNSCITRCRFDVISTEFNNSYIKRVLGHWLETQAKKDKSVDLFNSNKFVDRER